MNSPHGVPEPPRPTPAQIAATIVLLGDDRGPIQAEARERLLRWGELAVPQLREGAEAERVRTRARCRAVLRALEVRACLRRFARLRIGRSGRGSAPALLEGAVLLSNMVRTFVPDAAELAARLRRQASELRGQWAGRSLPTCARLLAERLHDQLGLQGGNASVLDLDHVLIDRVLRARIGIPVSLSLIYLLVARWAGLAATGVALPDHFLVRLHGVRPVLVDPYHGGRTITKADCARYLRASGHPQVREHLRDLTDREVLIHYLRGLRRAASQRAAPECEQNLGQALALLETT
ncbi:MAG TPA: transglutaminase-like domain-containing protein [Planctomycetota bacterium]|nr:transglutaminase-like domain-containing protein [Planctomycetota bacterium]